MKVQARVLVVEDSPEYQEKYLQWLSEKGYLIKTARNIKDAQQILQGEYFDLVIADMDLEGDKEGGITVLKEIQRIGDSADVLIISAWATRENVRDSEELFGATVLFKTELEKKILINAVEQKLQRPRDNFFEKEARDYWRLLVKNTFNDDQKKIISRGGSGYEALAQKMLPDLMPFSKNLPVIVKIFQTLHGDTVVHISGWSRGLGQAIVMRMGQKRTIEKESHAYNKFIKNLTESLELQKMGPFYYKNFGGLAYLLPKVGFGTLYDFENYYRTEDKVHIFQALEDIFQRREKISNSRDVDKLNIDLKLSYKKEIVDLSEMNVSNAIASSFKRDFVFYDIPVAISHGDLQMSNILISNDLQMQLLGYYLIDESDVIVTDNGDSLAKRAYQLGKRNLLHDYATLEVSIRKTLVNFGWSEKIEEFAQALNEINVFIDKEVDSRIKFEDQELEKSYQVITNLRGRAAKFLMSDETMDLYNSELLFQFLALFLYAENPVEKDFASHSLLALIRKKKDSS